jgi:hypothetical protein
VGHLLKNGSDRWTIVATDGHDVELSCGSVIEVRIGGSWIRTSIEHSSRDGYYATTKGIRLCDELPARLPRRR